MESNQGRVEQGFTREHVAREVELAERRFPFLELRRRRQYVIREPRCLRHEYVNDHGRVQGRQRPAHLRGIRQRVRQVRALHEHRAATHGVISENLASDDIARHEVADDRNIHDRAVVADVAPRHRMQLIPPDPR
jgi:hypothetical protein